MDYGQGWPEGLSGSQENYIIQAYDLMTYAPGDLPYHPNLHAGSPGPGGEYTHAARMQEYTFMTARKSEPPVKKTPPHIKRAHTHPVPPVPGPDFRIFFDNAPVATIIVGEDATIIRVNSRFEDLSGYPREEIEGKKSWTEFVAPQDVERLATYHHELVKPAGWAPSSYEFCFVDRNGKTTASALGVRKIPGTTDIIATIVDRTVEKKLEGLLRANEERYRVLVNNLSLGIYKNRIEHPGTILWANPALVRMFGYDSLADFMQQPIIRVYADPRDRERFTEELNRTGYVKDFEVLQRKKNGTPFWVRISAYPKKKQDGTIEWIEGTVEDIDSCKTTIETCRQKNQYLGEILDSAVTVGIIGTGPDGIITLFNRGAEQMLGYTAGEVVGKETPLIFHADEEISARARAFPREDGTAESGFSTITREARATGVDEQEWTYLRKGGTRITVNLTVTTITGRDGKDKGFLFMAKEITDKKRLEEAFRSSNLQMSGVIYNLPDATFAIDREGKVIAWNRAMEVITGIRAVDILGKGNYEYALPFYGERRPMLINLIASPDARIGEWGYSDIRRKGNAVTAETPALDKSNLPHVLWTIAAPIFDAAGEQAGAIETLADITERKRAQAVLQDSFLRFREILENTGAATAIIEGDDTISYINPEFERLLGYVREEVEGKKKWLEFVTPDDSVRMQEYRQKRKADPSGIPSRYEFRFIRWDGEVRTGFLSITNIPGTERIVVALFDITDKILAEEAVRRANKKLNFFSSITRHDILNQLTVLKGSLELTRQDTTDPGRVGIIDREIKAADAIEALITFTRDYQDIGLEPPVWQDLKTTVLTACAEIPLGSTTLSVEVDGVGIYADRLLEKVFFHMVRNAIDHGGKVTRIRIFCKESFEELHVICEDDGIGIPPDAKERIFNREFFMETGLDPYLAREILSITGISVVETGEYLEGARFELHVPKGGYRFTGTH